MHSGMDPRVRTFAEDISYNLARAVLRVIVLEVVTPGYGASGRGVGWLTLVLCLRAI
jgi:hypothetical protein